MGKSIEKGGQDFILQILSQQFMKPGQSECFSHLSPGPIIILQSSGFLHSFSQHFLPLRQCSSLKQKQGHSFLQVPLSSPLLMQHFNLFGQSSSLLHSQSGSGDPIKVTVLELDQIFLAPKSSNSPMKLIFAPAAWGIIPSSLVHGVDVEPPLTYRT